MSTYETKNPDLLCKCGHPKNRHFKGRGMCECRSAVNAYSSTCHCVRFRAEKPTSGTSRGGNDDTTFHQQT